MVAASQFQKLPGSPPTVTFKRNRDAQIFVFNLWENAEFEQGIEITDKPTIRLKSSGEFIRVMPGVFRVNLLCASGLSVPRGSSLGQTGDFSAQVAALNSLFGESVSVTTRSGQLRGIVLSVRVIDEAKWDDQARVMVEIREVKEGGVSLGRIEPPPRPSPGLTQYYNGIRVDEAQLALEAKLVPTTKSQWTLIRQGDSPLNPTLPGALPHSGNHECVRVGGIVNTIPAATAAGANAIGSALGNWFGTLAKLEGAAIRPFVQVSSLANEAAIKTADKLILQPLDTWFFGQKQSTDGRDC